MIAPPRPHELAKLTDLSARVGADIRWVQGGGGNASLKHEEILWIKASGTWLANAIAEDIFIPLSLPKVRERLARGEDNCAEGTIAGTDTRRASIETSLHALMPHRVVFHVHCVDTLRWGVLADGEAQLADRLRGQNWLWIPYRRPGAPLAAELAQRLSASRKAPDILVLQNHGLVVGADSPDAALARLESVRASLAAPARLPACPAPHTIAPNGYDWSEDSLFANLAFDATARIAARGGVLYPDHAVFLGAAFPEIQGSETKEQALLRWQEITGKAALYLVVPDEGVLLNKSINSGALAMLQCLGLVGSRIAPEDLAAQRVRYLSAVDVSALLNWDAEVYRQQVAQKTIQI